jgi:hypothetical protein
LRITSNKRKNNKAVQIHTNVQMKKKIAIMAMTMMKPILSIIPKIQHKLQLIKKIEIYIYNICNNKLYKLKILILFLIISNLLKSIIINKNFRIY